MLSTSISPAFIATMSPKRTYKVSYTYPVPDIEVRCATSTGWAIITKLVITLEDEGTIYDNGDGTKSGPLFMDYDGYGYVATSKGQIDKRSKLENRFISRSDNPWVQEFINDALLREGWLDMGDGSYILATATVRS